MTIHFRFKRTIYHFQPETNEVTVEVADVRLQETRILVRNPTEILYWHDGNWFQWNPNTQVMVLDAEEVPVSVRALDLLE